MNVIRSVKRPVKDVDYGFVGDVEKVNDMEKLHLYLVRHCESLGNRENIFQGQLDLDISATGEKQLALLALRFRKGSSRRFYPCNS